MVPFAGAQPENPTLVSAVVEGLMKRAGDVELVRVTLPVGVMIHSLDGLGATVDVSCDYTLGRCGGGW